jgi:hypothetical protein
MSRHEESFQIPWSPEQSKQLCAQAITSLGWPITSDLGHGLVSAETFQLGFTWPATMQVLLNYGDGGMSRVTVNASNFGFGPIQSSHVKGKVRLLRERIEEMGHQGWRPPSQPKPPSSRQAPSPSASRSGSPSPSAEPSAQPQAPPKVPMGPPVPPPVNAPMREVFLNGVRLREDQVTFLEQKYHSPLPSGNYWYDRMCGAWGVMGGPVLCTLEPNHDIGGPLQPGASLGNTGVFVNGRELHYLEIALLNRVVPMIIPGRWWLDVYGNFGSEGGPMLGNIWTLAQIQGVSGNENRSSVLSSWDRTRAAVFSG